MKRLIPWALLATLLAAPSINWAQDDAAEQRTEGAEAVLSRLPRKSEGEVAHKRLDTMKQSATSGRKVLMAKRRSTFVCDSIGQVTICADDKGAVCWWGPKNGFGCNF